jgi:hypothetical protein
MKAMDDSRSKTKPSDAAMQKSLDNIAPSLKVGSVEAYKFFIDRNAAEKARELEEQKRQTDAAEKNAQNTAEMKELLKRAEDNGVRFIVKGGR